LRIGSNSSDFVNGRVFILSELSDLINITFLHAIFGGPNAKYPIKYN